MGRSFFTCQNGLSRERREIITVNSRVSFCYIINIPYPCNYSTLKVSGFYFLGWHATARMPKLVNFNRRHFEQIPAATNTALKMTARRHMCTQIHIFLYDLHLSAAQPPRDLKVAMETGDLWRVLRDWLRAMGQPLAWKYYSWAAIAFLYVICITGGGV